MSTGSETASGQAEAPAATHQVLINDEEQYCLWPSAKAVPNGWKPVFEGTHEDCVAHVEKTWTDMRPKKRSGVTGAGSLTGTLPAMVSPTPWLPVQRRAGSGAGPGSVLVCFPPAGAGAGFFREWAASLPGIRIVPVQLPGREERFSEAPAEDATEIAGSIAEAIAAEGWDRPVLLGYSYGALLAFETALQLETDGIDVGGLITMARAAPQTMPQPTVADLDDDAFLGYVRRLGGLPPEIDDVPEFVELMLPVMRADFRANDHYARAGNARLRCSIRTIAGASDAATANGRDAAWADRTASDHGLVRIDGGHFFVNETPTVTFNQIRNMISSVSHAGGSKA